MEHLSHSEAETELLGEALAKALSPGSVVAYAGGLGMGKTAFTRGLARGLGYTGRVTSPTFAIVNEYDTELCRVCHFDMYRILDEDALYDIGWDDYFDGDTILLVEWSENVQEAMEGAISVSIAKLDENTRRITIDQG